MTSTQNISANEMVLDIPSTPQCLRQPMVIPKKTLMGAGPSNTPDRVLSSLSNPTLGHLHAECTKIMDDVKEGIQYIFQTRNTLTIALSASGHGGMEALLCNLLEDGEVVLIGSTGIWGQRAATMAARYGATVQVLESPVGFALTYDQIREALIKYRPVLFFIVQGDSSTGVLQKIEGLGDLCHEYNCLLGVDTVASLGGTPFFADRWGVDAVYTGSQKVLGAPAGITPISFSPRAERKILSRRSLVKVYYFDMSILGDYWACFGKPRVYHHTISTTLLYGLREAISMACEEGFLALWSRTKTCAQRLYTGLAAMNVELLVTDVESRLPTITTIKVPSDVDAGRVIKFAMERYSLEIAGGLGPTAGKVFRIGLMGPNATPENVDLVLSVLAETFLTCKLSKM